MKPFVNSKWKKIESGKVQVFQLDDEPEIIYLIEIRDNEYMIVHEDAYDMNTGKVEFLNRKDIKDIYGINPNLIREL